LRNADRLGKRLRGTPRDAILADAAPEDMQGRAYGLNRGMDCAGAVLGTLIAATLLQWSGMKIPQVILLSVVPGLAVLILRALLPNPTSAAQIARAEGAARAPLTRPLVLSGAFAASRSATRSRSLPASSARAVKEESWRSSCACWSSRTTRTSWPTCMAISNRWGTSLDSERNGDAGLSSAGRNAYDAIVLDLALPGIDGLELCRRLRNELRQSTPVLMLTARDTLQDKVVGFESGADDYLVKPFLLAELDVRLKALVRRARDAHVETVMQVGDLRFDTTTRTVTRSGRRIELTPTGYKLLAQLMRTAPKVVTREALEYDIWGDEPPDSDALRTHIHSLRQAFDKPFEAPMLKTLQGIGYRLAAPQHRTLDEP